VEITAVSKRAPCFAHISGESFKKKRGVKGGKRQKGKKDHSKRKGGKWERSGNRNGFWENTLKERENTRKKKEV